MNVITPRILGDFQNLLSKQLQYKSVFSFRYKKLFTAAAFSKSHFTTEETFTLLYRVVRVVVPHASARQSKLIATNIAYAWVTCRNMSN